MCSLKYNMRVITITLFEMYNKCRYWLQDIRFKNNNQLDYTVKFNMCGCVTVTYYMVLHCK